MSIISKDDGRAHMIKNILSQIARSECALAPKGSYAVNWVPGMVELRWWNF
jgi:hypothetical protein